MTRDDMPGRLRGHEGHRLPPEPHDPPKQYPSICRAVVFYGEVYDGYGGEPAGDGNVVFGPKFRAVAMPAVVQAVHDAADPESAVDLFVQHARGSSQWKVPYGPGKPGHWGWPPRR